jgi:hypothetical protein
VVGTSYRIAPLQVDLGKTVTSDGSDPATVTYALAGEHTAGWFVSSSTGDIFGQFSSAGLFHISLMAVDGGGQHAKIEESVSRSFQFPVSPILFAGCNDLLACGCSHSFFAVQHDCLCVWLFAFLFLLCSMTVCACGCSHSFLLCSITVCACGCLPWDGCPQIG